MSQHCSLLYRLLFISGYSVVVRDLHSFPTRRSSDLAGCAENADQETVSTVCDGEPIGIAVYVSDLSQTKEYEKLKSDMIRSEEHTSELQSPCNLVCRLLLEKKE